MLDPVILCFTCSRRRARVVHHDNRNTTTAEKWLGDDGEIVVELPREEEEEGGDGGDDVDGGEHEGGEASGKGKRKAKAKPRRFTAVRVDRCVAWEGRDGFGRSLVGRCWHGKRGWHVPNPARPTHLPGGEERSWTA